MNMHALAAMRPSDVRADRMYAITRSIDDASPQKPRLLQLVGDLAMADYEASSKQADLQLSINAYLAAVRLIHDFTLEHVTLLEYLGRALYRRGQTNSNVQDLASACYYLEMSVPLMPDTDHRKSGILSDIGNSHQVNFELDGNFKHLEAAISAGKKALKLNLDGPTQRAVLLTNLGCSLSSRFSLKGDHTDLQAAINLAQESVKLLSDGQPDKPSCLRNLGVRLFERFEIFHTLEDLQAAIQAFRNATRLSPKDDSLKGQNYMNWGACLQRRSEHTNSDDDLEVAIRMLQRAIELIPDLHPHKPAALANLGNALQAKFKRRGNMADLDLSVNFLQRAVAVTPTGHPDVPGYLNNLGNMLEIRYKRFKHLEDLEAAVNANQQAVFLTPDLHLDKPARLMNLGVALNERFRREHHIGDLHKAIEVGRAAVGLTPVGNVNRSLCLDNLVSNLINLFHRLDDLALLDEALTLIQEAVQLCPPNHPQKAGHFYKLGDVLSTRYQKLEKLEDLEAALEAGREAIGLTGDDESFFNRATYLVALAGWEGKHWRATGDINSLKQGMLFASKAVQHPASHPASRLAGALQWIILAMSCDNHTDLLAACTSAIQLIPEVAWFGLEMKRQHEELKDVPMIIRLAVTAALDANNPDLALEWLEQGRSVVWGQTLQLRSPVDGLRQHHPKLAEQLVHVSHQLEVGDYGKAGDRREALRGLVVKRDELLKHIRKQDGFDNFLGPKRVCDLHRAARGGPVVSICVWPGGGEALILIPGLDKVVHVSLPEITQAKADELVRVLDVQHSAMRMRGDESSSDEGTRARGFKIRELQPPESLDTVISRVLGQIWTWIVEPVFKALDLSPHRGEDLPRIWWAPSGPLVFLPLHSAGLYNTNEVGSKVFDYVVSSYTPSVTALLETHIQPSATVKIMAVAQPTTPKCSPLPQTRNELQKLRLQAQKASIEVLEFEGKEGTVERVINGMSDYNWVHFACHGTQDLSDPAKSALLLADGNLELEQIIKRRLPYAEFAFLSACQTATGDVEHKDEAVHLAAGMLLAGYQSVIATLWSINDMDGPLVAEEVYAEMLKGGKPDCMRAALGLHKAVKKLRDGGASFLSWMPFVHFGA